MFTGLIKEMGRIAKVAVAPSGALRLIIAAPETTPLLNIGGSVAVDGCCLTCVRIDKDQFEVDLTPETVNKTSFPLLREGSLVNLELPLLFNGRIDGHLVQGHIDGMGKIVTKIALPDGSWEVEIAPPLEFIDYIVSKGSIAVDGVSLTIAARNTTCFKFAMIPHTARLTTLGLKQPGDSVNLEIDLMAKYAKQWVKTYA